MKPIRFTDHGRKRAKVMQALPDEIQLAVNSPEVVISVLPRGQVFKRDSKGRVL